MAQQTTVILVDDLDDTLSAVETIRFGVDGTHYAIDLSAEHADALREDLATWVSHARRTRTRTTRGAAQPQRSRSRTSADREQTTTVRDWARSNGYPVSDRGRIPAAVQEAFDSAH